MDIKQAIARVLERKDLSADEMTAVMQTIMTGGATPAQIGGFLVGLRMKGESVNEIAAAAGVMRELAAGVDISGLDHAVDIVGTGGDASGTFNVSTASMFVAAAAGCHVAKHGNRSVSSKSGSADALEKAGLRLDLSPQQVAQCVREVGVGFMFAPMHHSAMKQTIGPRKEMAVRTIFNVLGPLTNPASADRQLMGVYSPGLTRSLAEVLRGLGVNFLILAGITTAWCIRSTATDAYQRDFRVAFAEDCLASFTQEAHARAVLDMSTVLGPFWSNREIEIRLALGRWDVDA